MAVACGRNHTLTLDDEGNVYSFGSNYFGQSGIVNKIPGRKPGRILELSNIVQIAAGGDSSACLDDQGNLWTFGKNNRGQLGLMDVYNRATPCKVTRINNIISVSCGSEFILCLTEDNVVYGFGNNDNGQIGVRPGAIMIVRPEIIPIDDKIASISCGGCHSVLLSTTGDVWVFGRNDGGGLGLGDRKDRTSPVKNPYLSNIVSVRCGYMHTVVMNSENQVFSFGYNGEGALALVDSRTRTSPEQVPFPEEVHSIYCNLGTTIILDTCGFVWIFGCDRLKQEKIKGFFNGYTLQEPKNVYLVSTGGGHLIMKTISNEVWGYGFNENGQLSISTPEILIPIQILHKKPEIIGTPRYIKNRHKSARK